MGGHRWFVCWVSSDWRYCFDSVGVELHEVKNVV